MKAFAFIVLVVVLLLSGFYIGKAVYNVNITPGTCLDATTQTIGESIDNFIKNVKG